MSRTKNSIKPERLHPAVEIILNGSARITFKDEDTAISPRRRSRSATRHTNGTTTYEGKEGFNPALASLVRCLQADTLNKPPEGYAEFMAEEKRHFERAASMALLKRDAEFFRQVHALMATVERKRTHREIVVTAHGLWMAKNSTPPTKNQLKDIIERELGESIPSNKITVEMDKADLPWTRVRGR